MFIFDIVIVAIQNNYFGHVKHMSKNKPTLYTHSNSAVIIYTDSRYSF